MKKAISLFVFLVVFVCMICAEAETVDIKVKGMVCDFCARTIERSFERTGKVESVDVDLDNGLVQVSTKQGVQMSDKEITRIITDAGYNLESIDKK